MPRNRSDPVTILVVTAVALMIWYFAAGETRSGEAITLTVRIAAPDAATWRVRPERVEVLVSAEGPARALRAAGQIESILIAPPETDGDHEIDLVDALRADPLLAAAGVTIVGARPASVEVQVRQLVQERVEVARTLRGVTTVGETTTEPREVLVTLPRRLREEAFPAALVVEPMLSSGDLEGLAPGRSHVLEGVRLRLAGARRTISDGEVTIEPAKVRLSFELQSRTTSLRLERPVRVQLLAPPEDEGRVLFDPVQLRDVVVEGPAPLIEEIRSGGARVVAVVVLKSTEREARIDRKRVSHFIVERADGSAQTIRAWIGDGAQAVERPEVTIAIGEDEPNGSE